MTDHEHELLEAVLGADPGLTRPIPSSTILADFVMPHILKIRDDGNGNLRQLPLIGSTAWENAGDGVKWAVVAILALQGVWAAERGPDERVAYAEGADRVDSLIDWGAEAYRLGFEAGRREQAQVNRRQRRRIEAA
ncbi:hypothetical protein RCF27_01235 [Rhodococcus pyridinivorans]|uniref:hypothetical protein n=1 Tax=Rhodococcus pyridinivorans TaxID=103816 RepID=UPI00280A5337|nr:hypothetical protein [Rhodococcus pyridinivorans]WMM73007.1 hypothetical protein RCF27_01235 [Rhodococcus pyridinivorans]